MAAGTKDQIESAVASLLREVPALQKLKLVFGLELRGRGDVQLYRVEVPGPKISNRSRARTSTSSPPTVASATGARPTSTGTSRSRATRTSRS
jgi:hypothetical protein